MWPRARERHFSPKQQMGLFLDTRFYYTEMQKALEIFVTTTTFFGRVLRLRRNVNWPKYASFDSLFFRAGLGHLGKRWIVRGTNTRKKLPYWANSSTLLHSSTRAGTGISVAV